MPLTTTTIEGLGVRICTPGPCPSPKPAAEQQALPLAPLRPDTPGASQCGPAEDQDPRPHQLAGAVATALLEVLARRRAVEQVQYLLDEPSLRMVLAWRRQALWQQTRLHGVRACPVGDGVVEASLVLEGPRGHFGAVLRLVSTGRRWQVVLFDVVRPDSAMARAA